MDKNTQMNKEDDSFPFKVLSNPLGIKIEDQLNPWSTNSGPDKKRNTITRTTIYQNKEIPKEMSISLNATKQAPLVKQLKTPSEKRPAQRQAQRPRTKIKKKKSIYEQYETHILSFLFSLFFISLQTPFLFYILKQNNLVIYSITNNNGLLVFSLLCISFEMVLLYIIAQVLFSKKNNL